MKFKEIKSKFKKSKYYDFYKNFKDKNFLINSLLKSNSKTKLLDTRKTTTGMRFLEKYATKIGGALNHRVGLFDKILVKDNHIKFLGGISATLNIIKKNKIKNYIIECDSFHQVQKCIEFGSKYILLDNMGVSEIKKCVKLNAQLIPIIEEIPPIKLVKNK